MLTGISILYFICLGVGFLFALISAIFGELFGHGEVAVGGHGVEIGHGVDASHEVGVSHEVSGHEGHGGAEASVFNTITIAVFVTLFGLAGLFAVHVLRLSSVVSLAFALPTAVLSAAVQFVLYVRIFIRAQASSEATMSEVLGCEAEVITGIPGDRVGEIAYVIKGTRYNAPALSADGQEIAKGSRVHVVNVRGTTLVVRAM